MNRWWSHLWYKMVSWTGRYGNYCNRCEKYCKYHVFRWEGMNLCYNCLSEIVYEAWKKRGK